MRHPFERLVSAYRDKFELGSRSDYIYLTYAAAVLQLAGKESQSPNFKAVLSAPRPTFRQFVDYLLRTKVGVVEQGWHMWRP